MSDVEMEHQEDNGNSKRRKLDHDTNVLTENGNGNGNGNSNTSIQPKNPTTAVTNTATTKTSTSTGRNCPYLDTVNRSLLDFDFEHSCSVSLQSGPHIYACLVCGKFFLGRGSQTPAYTHSVDENSHNVFVHLTKGTFHCLPDNYEIKDASLSDISNALHPKFTEEEILLLDTKQSLARDLFGKKYLPGFVGLNNLSKTDYVNATIQALVHVRPLRDFFLRHSEKTEEFSPLASCFGELCRKIWSDKRFKSNVDPHMMIQAISVASNKKYHIGKQVELGEFMAWFLHQLHLGVLTTNLNKKKKRNTSDKSIIHEIFQGQVEVTTRVRKRNKKKQITSNGQASNENEVKQSQQQPEWIIEEKTIDTNFLQLTLDIPEKPLFKDDNGGLVIPQEPLPSVLKKFDGVSFMDVLVKSQSSSSDNSHYISQKKRYRLKKLPNYLILHLARFKKNGFHNTEKNPTIVAFPVKNLDLKRYCNDLDKHEEDDSKDSDGTLIVKSESPSKNGKDLKKKKKKKKLSIPSEEKLKKMNTDELTKFLKKYGRSDLVASAQASSTSSSSTVANYHSKLLEYALDFLVKSIPQLLQEKYDLVANITHDSPQQVGKEGKRDPLEEGSYRCHVQHLATKQWYEMQDLHVQETMPQLIALSESYVLIFEKKGMYNDTSDE